MARHRHPSTFEVATCDGGCMVCCDCRRGLHVDISGILPVIDTVYTRSKNGVENDFTFRTISYGADSSQPYFLGTVVDGDGKPFRECCERVIATAQADFTDDADAEFEKGGLVLVLGMREYSGVSEVYLLIRSTDANFLDTYIFHFYRESAQHLCNTPRGEYSDLGNIQAAQYLTTKGYLTEFESDVLPVKPVFGNSDGGYLHQGLAPVARTTDAYVCACSDCYGPTAYTVTVSNLSALCFIVMQPDVDEVELEIPADYTCAPQGDSTETLSDEYEGTPIECGSNPFETCFGAYNSTWTVQAAVLTSDEGLPEWGGNNTRIVVTVTFTCDGEIPTTYTAFVTFYTMSLCAGGIQSATATGLELDFGLGVEGTIDVEIAPA